MAGKFDPAAVKAAITQSFSSWKRGDAPLIQIPTTAAKHELDVVDRPGAAQSTVYVGLPTIDPSNSDFIQLQVMNTLLGGSFGSRITANIREQKGIPTLQAARFPSAIATPSGLKLQTLQPE